MVRIKGMRCISVWQPYATLLVKGIKRIETRPNPAPSTVLGERIGIASTKIITPAQRAAMIDPEFARHYAETGLPELDFLHHGYLLGTVVVKSSTVITQDDIDDITEEELSYGWFEHGRYAWRTTDNVEFNEPIPVRGSQGIWIYDGPSPKLRIVS